MLRVEVPRPASRPRELDEAAEKFIRSQGAEPAFKGYRGFPGSICASPNSMVVHGIPGAYELAARRHPLASTSASTNDGWVADAAMHVPGRRRSRPMAAQAARRHREALFAASSSAGPATTWATSRTRSRSGSRRDGLLDRSARWSATGSAATCTRTRRSPTSASPGRGPLLEEGMVLAIEPMVNAGGPDGPHGRRRLGRSTPQDGSLAAHFEFTVAVTADGPRILTPWHEE